MDAKKRSAISKQCLQGAPMPKSLEALWDAFDDEDELVIETLGLSLLTSRDVLGDGYGDELLKESEDVAANDRAHRKVFERLAFFAQADDGELLAFDVTLEPKTDPPIVQLDTEGEYEWLGVNLSEAICRLAESLDAEDEAREWLEEHDLSAADWGELGSTTGHLPSLGKLQRRYYRELLGNPPAPLPVPAEPANPKDAASWFLRPGPEVLAVLRETQDLDDDEFLEEQWLECDGDGRVTTIWLHETEGLALHGVTWGDSRERVLAKLGPPAQEWDGERARWNFGAAYALVEFEQDAVSSLFLGQADD
jgi:hypothetical protein